MKATTRRDTANTIVGRTLTGGVAHVPTHRVFDGLDWRAAGTRVKGSPHTAYELLNHMIFWQDGVLQWLKGRTPAMPEHASVSWPGDPAPTTRAEWLEAVRHFQTGLSRLERAAKRATLARKGRTKSALTMLADIGMHNSYHAGQVALLRRVLRSWPPPSGGMTW